MIRNPIRKVLTTQKGIMLLLLLLWSITAGCSTTIKENHYFKSETQPNQIPNYFRLTVSGHTLLSSARYLSGYYDEDVVNQYFNEIGQPDKGRLIPIGQPTSDTSKTVGDNQASTSSASKLTNTAQGLKNPALILLLSSNSDDIANQIGALAQSQEFTSSLSTLLASSRFEAADKAESRLRNYQARGHVIATIGDQLISGMPDNSTEDFVEARMLDFVNQLSADLGAPRPFISLDEAADWLRANRSRLHQEGLK